jgi:hypothetical protein
VPTSEKRPIVVSDTPVSVNQMDRVAPASRNGNPLAKPIKKTMIKRFSQ